MVRWARLRAPVAGMGSATMVLLLVAATGLLLLPSYRPEPGVAHDDVQAIRAGPLGLVRALHAWGAHAAAVLLIVGVARAWTRTGDVERAPRRWFARLAIAAAVLLGLLTGGILAWDQHAWESLRHVDALADRVHEPGEAPLSLILWIHVLAALGAAIAVLVRGRPSWATRVGLRRTVLGAAPVFALILVLALAFPPPLGPAPIEGVAASRPWWPFLWLTPLEAWLGQAGLVLGLATVAALVLLAPWSGRRLDAPRRVLALWMVAGALFSLTALALVR